MPSHRQCSASRCTSWMRAVRLVRHADVHVVLARSGAAILPPPAPVSATTRTPSSCAAWIAATTLRELPLVEMASSASPRAPDAAHLLGEDLLVGVVVRDRGERRGVGGERHRGERRALDLEAVEELGGEMLRVGSRAAVAAGEHLAAPLEDFGEERACPRDRRGQRARRVELELGAFGKLRANARRQVLRSRRRILHRHSTNTSISMRRAGFGCGASAADARLQRRAAVEAPRERGVVAPAARSRACDRARSRRSRWDHAGCRARARGRARRRRAAPARPPRRRGSESRRAARSGRAVVRRRKQLAPERCPRR